MRPTAIAEAAPVTPFTESGGVASPEELPPQQTTAPVPALIAQLWALPAAIAVAVPAVPFTDGGGVACPTLFAPQQTTAPVPDWIAQLNISPTAIAEAVICGGGAPAPHPTTGPAVEAALAATARSERLTVTANLTSQTVARIRMVRESDPADPPNGLGARQEGRNDLRP